MPVEEDGKNLSGGFRIVPVICTRGGKREERPLPEEDDHTSTAFNKPAGENGREEA